MLCWQAGGQINYLFLVTYQEHHPGASCREIPLRLSEGKLQMCPVLSKEALLNLLYWVLVVFVLSSQVNTRQTLYIVQCPAQKGLGITCQQGLSGICKVPKVTGSARGEQEDRGDECCHLPRPKCASRALGLSTVPLSQAASPVMGPEKPSPEVWIHQESEGTVANSSSIYRCHRHTKTQ